MDPKVCPTCGGEVDVTIVNETQDDGTHASYAVGRCRSCGQKFTEAEVLALEGPGPVAG